MTVWWKWKPLLPESESEAKSYRPISAPPESKNLRNVFSTIFDAPPMFRSASKAGDDDDDEGVGNFDVFFCVNDEDLFQEICWASTRPESVARTLSGACAFADVNSFREAIANFPATVLKECCRSLTSTERRVLQTNIESKPGVVYQLNQNPDFSESMSTEDTLGTVIRNAGILWSFKLD